MTHVRNVKENGGMPGIALTLNILLDFEPAVYDFDFWSVII